MSVFWNENVAIFFSAVEVLMIRVFVFLVDWVFADQRLLLNQLRKTISVLNGKTPFSALEISLIPVRCCQSLGRVQLCDSVDHCTPSLPVLHCLLEPTQTHDSCSCRCINYFTLVIKMFISPHVYDFIYYRFKSLI